MNLESKRAAALESAMEAKAAMEADPTEETIKAAQEAADLVKSLDRQIEEAKAAKAALDSLSRPVEDRGVDAPKASPRSLGDHVRKSVGDRLVQMKGAHASVVAPEFKAADDAQVTGGHDGAFRDFLTDVDRTIVQEYRRPTVTGLFGQGQISGQAITYFVEQGREGDFTTVAEGAQLAQLHYEDPIQVTDALSKVGGFIKLSDEMLQDLDYVVSEIDGRLLYDLSLVEEAQILAGDGTGSNIQGLLNRDGVQVASTDAEGLADEIFKSMTRISNATGLEADALVINPADYEGLRLAKDANGQYFGGGMFAGQYGMGGLVTQPPLWGLRTVVSPAVAVGSPVVGAFTAGATVYRKGGVSVEATNSDQSDFLQGLVTVRATERIALAVRKPAAFVKITVE